MAVSLEYYYNLVFWINYVVYLGYFLIKYVVAPILWFILKLANRRRNGCLGKFAIITKPMQSIILLTFGKQLAIKQIAEEKDENRIPKMTLHKRRLSYVATMVLFTLIAAFWILALGSALDLTLLSVTHTCSEDPQIDCYPQLITGVNDTGLNISISEPIRDCSFWNSKGVSDRVSFVCYQFIFNVELFLAVVGGLLALFIYTAKTTIALLLSLTVCCLCGSTNTNKIVRIIVAVITSLIEIALAILCLVLGATGTTVDNTEDTPELLFVSMHASEVLVAFGIVATLLWLPWEQYTSKPPEHHSEYHTPAPQQGAETFIVVKPENIATTVA
jgi:hypothetical protein